MTPLKLDNNRQLRGYEKNLGATTGRENTRLIELAKGELMTDFMKQFMKSNGITRMTVDLLHSPEYLKSLRKYLEIFMPMVLDRMRQAGNGKKE